MGIGSPWNDAQQAALIAPAAVEWFTEASPKLQTTIAPRGTGTGSSSREARSSMNAAPTALGRCEAMVDVCGGICSARLPKTLCLPPEIGSSFEAVRPSRTSRSGNSPEACRPRARKNAPER